MSAPFPLIHLIQSRSSFGAKNSAASLCNTKLLLGLEFTFYGLPDARVHRVPTQLVKERHNLPIFNKEPSGTHLRRETCPPSRGNCPYHTTKNTPAFLYMVETTHLSTSIRHPPHLKCLSWIETVDWDNRLKMRS